MAYQAQKVSIAFKKPAPGLLRGQLVQFDVWLKMALTLQMFKFVSSALM